MLGPYWVGDTPTEGVDVTITRDGEAVDLSTYTDAVIELHDAAGAPIDTTGVAVTMTHETVSFEWPTDRSLFLTAGRYSLQVVLVADGRRERAALLTFDVKSPSLSIGTSWATPQDVLTLTGKVVDIDDIERAAASIDAVTGAADLDITKLNRRNRRMLKLATAYQAAWLRDQFDTFDRHDVTSLSQEGSSTSARDELTFILAPLAKAALRRATWSNNRTVSVGTVRPRIVDPVVSDAHPWGRRI